MRSANEDLPPKALMLCGSGFNSMLNNAFLLIFLAPAVFWAQPLSPINRKRNPLPLPKNRYKRGLSHFWLVSRKLCIMLWNEKTYITEPGVLDEASLIYRFNGSACQ